MIYALSHEVRKRKMKYQGKEIIDKNRNQWITKQSSEEGINEDSRWFFEEINKIYKSLARLMKKKKREIIKYQQQE